MGKNSLRVDQAIILFERYKTLCVLYGCSKASEIDCIKPRALRQMDFNVSHDCSRDSRE